EADLNLSDSLSGTGSSSGAIPGPFIFEFSMPMNPIRRVAELNQNLRAPGGDMTIERVIVTESETHVIRQYAGLDGNISRCGQPIGSLRAGPWSSPPTKADGESDSWRSNGHCTYRHTQTSLLDKHGDWTLTIDTLLNTF